MNQDENSAIYTIKFLSRMFLDIALRKMQVRIQRRGGCSLYKSKIWKENIVL